MLLKCCWWEGATKPLRHHPSSPGQRRRREPGSAGRAQGMRAIGRERGQSAERLARDTAGHLGEKKAWGRLSVRGTGRRPTGSGRGAPGPASRVRVRERAVPGDRETPNLGRAGPGLRSRTPAGAPFGCPRPGPAGSQGEPLRLEGAGRSAAPLPGDAKAPRGRPEGPARRRAPSAR